MNTEYGKPCDSSGTCVKGVCINGICTASYRNTRGNRSVIKNKTVKANSYGNHVNQMMNALKAVVYKVYVRQP